MSDRPDTEIVAALLARGYNRHIKDHGPDGSYASETMESGDGHAVMVERDGSQFAVRVERLPARTADVPKTPGQCWAALREHIKQERAAQNDIACDHSELTGHEQQEERAFGRVEAYDEMLATMDRMTAQ